MTCPNCGYCPHCGRSNWPRRPYNPYNPWNPWWWYQIPYQNTYTVSPGTINTSGGTYTLSS